MAINRTTPEGRTYTSFDDKRAVARIAAAAQALVLPGVRGFPNFDDLVEFAASEPDASALRAVINFDALSGRS